MGPGDVGDASRPAVGAALGAGLRVGVCRWVVDTCTLLALPSALFLVAILENLHSCQPAECYKNL